MFHVKQSDASVEALVARLAARTARHVYQDYAARGKDVIGSSPLFRELTAEACLNEWIAVIRPTWIAAFSAAWVEQQAAQSPDRSIDP